MISVIALLLVGAPMLNDLSYWYSHLIFEPEQSQACLKCKFSVANFGEEGEDQFGQETRCMDPESQCWCFKRLQIVPIHHKEL